MNQSWIDRQKEKVELAEVRVLGTALARPDLADQIVAALDPSMFARDAHRIVAETLWRSRRDSGTVDVETVADLLVGDGKVDEVGGVAGLFDLVRHGENDLRAVSELRRLARGRDLYRLFGSAQTELTNPANEPDDVAASVLSRLHDREPLDSGGPISTDELLLLAPPRWLIDGVLPEGLSVLIGSAKSGKTFLALSMAWALATGSRWFGRETVSEPLTVLYLVGEGTGNVRLRVEALIEATDTHPGGLMQWWTEPLSLSRERDVARLRLEVERCGADLVVVDTWRRYSGLVNENDASETALAVGCLEDLCVEGRSVIVVHHTNAEGDLRGSKALSAAVESALKVSRSDIRKDMLVEPWLSRRGEGFKPMKLRWRPSGPDFVLEEIYGGV